MIVEIAKIQVRRGQENVTGVPQLDGGEFAWAADTEKLYIGLRRDDGGARNANIEILTENHLRNFFRTVSTATQSVYVYRPDSYITALDGDNEYNGRIVQNKLDDLDVSIENFGPVGEGNGDSAIIQLAIDNLFLFNPTTDPSGEGPTVLEGKDPARVLRFPPGTFNINKTIFIPKNTKIVGEGIDKTIFNVTSNVEHVFQTVDSIESVGSLEGGDEGYVTFDTAPATITSAGQPSNIHIEGMTLKYDNELTDPNQTYSLISLDCANNAILKNIKFKGNYTTSTIVDAVDHIGVDIRGYNEVSTENVLIDNCYFENLYFGIKSNFDILNPTINNSKFTESHKGIVFGSPLDGTASIGPRLAKITNNRFENIEQEAIYSSAYTPPLGTSVVGTNHISVNNQFVNVGNINILDSEESTTGTAVISFNSKFNRSVNDYFDRYDWHTRDTSDSNTYHPLINGHVSFDITPGSVTILPTDSASILKLPIINSEQHITLNYNLYGTNVSRKGTLIINVSAGTDPETSLTDNYTYFDNDGSVEWSITKDVDKKWFKLVALNPNLSTLNIEHQTTILL